MKDLKKITGFFIVVAFMCMSARTHAQQQDHKNGYNTALNYYNNQDYNNAINYLNSYMTSMEENPSGWVGGGDVYVEFIYKVYRLAGACYYNSGDSASADVIVDNLSFVLSDYFYESDVINRYNETRISGY